MKKHGISIILRAGSNAKDAETFVSSLAARNTYKSLEVFVLSSEPKSNFLKLASKFSSRLRIAIISSSEKSIASITRLAHYDTLLLVSTPSQIKKNNLAELAQIFTRQDNSLMPVQPSILTNGVLISSDTAESLDDLPVYATHDELLAHAEKGINYQEPEKNTPHWRVQTEGEPLDTQLSVLESTLHKKDDQLTRLYNEIEKLDKRHDALPSGSDAQLKLKKKLKILVEESNDRLKELKEMFDELEHLRIRKYSLQAEG